MSIPTSDEREIFLAALDRSTPEERESFIAEACGENALLRNRIAELLDAHAKSVGPLDAQSPINGTTTTFRPVTEKAGDRIGSYKLLQQIGEGGFGVVYMAEQEHPVRRKVALKIIKPGMDTREVVARFESERQALAMMDHPNIARVLDAGATDSGRPYFVMELVRGISITHFCDRNHMPAQKRLELFVGVCHAIQHAHHKGVIHRDIKPSNVLVTLHDGVPAVKVIDFGIAKATASRLTEQTLFTRFGQMIGTPSYMSPEQAEMSGLDIDTRSDVYSLGVLLFELLTGTTPVDEKRLRAAGYAEMQRIIREEEAPKPSNRLSTLGEEATVLAGNRGADIKKLRHFLAGDLDRIALKALDKDRNRRYDTPGSLAQDVERFLRQEPIVARPPSALYVAKRFLRRNRGFAAGFAAVSLALVLGAIGATWQAVRASRAEHEALAALGEKEQALIDVGAQRAKAEARGNELKAANEQILRRLAQIDKANNVLALPFDDVQIDEIQQDRPVEAILAERMVKAAAELERGDAADPIVSARMQNRLGGSLLAVGFADAAIPLLKQALATREEQLGSGHADTLSTMHNLASGYHFAHQLDEALPLYRSAFVNRETYLGPDHAATLASMNNLAFSYLGTSQFDLATPLFEKILARRRQALGEDHLDTLRSAKNLAAAENAAGHHDLAISMYGDVLRRIKKALGPEHSLAWLTMKEMATAIEAAGTPDLAVPLYEEMLAVKKARPDVALSIMLPAIEKLASAYDRSGKFEKAIPLYEEVLSGARAQLRQSRGKANEGREQLITAMDKLASVYKRAGQRDKALPLYEEMVKLTATKLGLAHAETVARRESLAAAYESAGKMDLAIPLREEVLKQRRATLGSDHQMTLVSLNDLASAHRLAGRPDLAIPFLKEIFEYWQKSSGPKNPNTLMSMEKLAEAYEAMGQADRARPLFQELFTVRQGLLGTDHPATRISGSRYQSATEDIVHRYREREQDILVDLENKFRDSISVLGPDHGDTLRSMEKLASGYHQARKPELAVLLLNDALLRRKAVLGVDHLETLRTQHALNRAKVRLAGQSTSEWRVSYFQWDGATGNKMPTDWDKLMQSKPVNTEKRTSIDFTWGAKAPIEGVSPDRFAVAATCTADFAGGIYECVLEADDWARVLLDGKVLLDARSGMHGDHLSKKIELSRGTHELRVEYYQIDGEATLTFGLLPQNIVSK